MTFSPAPRVAGPPLSAPEPVPRLLRDLLHERTGLHFETERLGLMLEKLEPRVRFHQCPSFLDYYYILKYEEKGPEELRRVMDAFSVQETYFWREYDQVKLLVDVLVPAWFRRTSLPLRIWSAACATGEEPYSIVMALNEAGWGNHPIEIIASDASEAALAKARAGIFRERSFRALPTALREKYFQAQSDGMRLNPEIVQRVNFRCANLVKPAEYSDLQNVAVIFCRNVFIYFSTDSIKWVTQSFAERVPPGGHLFIGSSESLLKITNQFELQEINGAFVYLRKATGGGA